MQSKMLYNDKSVTLQYNPVIFANAHLKKTLIQRDLRLLDNN